MIENLPEDVLASISDADRIEYASLLGLAGELYAMNGQHVIVHAHEIGIFLGVASDATDLYYIIQRSNGDAYWASAVGWISALKGRLPDDEYEAIAWNSPDVAPMQIVVDDQLHRRWLAGSDHSHSKDNDLIEIAIRCRDNIMRDANHRSEWMPRQLMRQIQNLIPERDPRRSVFYAAMRAPELHPATTAAVGDVLMSDILFGLHAARDRANSIIGQSFNDIKDQAVDLLRKIGGMDDIIESAASLPAPLLDADDTENTFTAVDLAYRLWPHADYQRGTELDDEVANHFYKISPYTEWFLLKLLQDNAWIIGRISEHRSQGKLMGNWVPAAYFCATFFPNASQFGFPGMESDLALIFSDLGKSLH